MTRIKERGGGGEEKYETNHWSTHVNIVRLAKPNRRPVRYRAGFAKSWGLSASVSFLPHPLPSLSFFDSRFIFRASKTENPVPQSCFAPKPNGNVCYAGLDVRDIGNGRGRENNVLSLPAPHAFFALVFDWLTITFFLNLRGVMYHGWLGSFQAFFSSQPSPWALFFLT